MSEGIEGETAETAEAVEATPASSRPFRRMRKSGPRLPGDQAKRQGEITHLAFALLGGRDAALSFLNTHHDGLDARPLELASGSAAGFDTVHDELQRLAGGTTT